MRHSKEITMTEEFNQWWNSESLTDDNLYPQDSPAYWAWEGWQAATESEREACARVLDKMAEQDKLSNYYRVAALAIRERGAP
jgi:hypothetical protein